LRQVCGADVSRQGTARTHFRRPPQPLPGIPIANFTDFASEEPALLADPNPFALVTAAHMLTQQTRKPPELRAEAKWRLAQVLYTRNWDAQR